MKEPVSLFGADGGVAGMSFPLPARIVGPGTRDHSKPSFSKPVSGGGTRERERRLRRMAKKAAEAKA